MQLRSRSAVAALASAALATLAIAVPGALASGASTQYPCSNKQTTLAMLMCLDGQIRTLNAQLSGVVAKIAAHEQRKAAADLATAQQAWKRYVDADCVAQSEIYAGGTLQPVAQEQCVVLDSQARLAELSTFLKGLESQ